MPDKNWQFELEEYIKQGEPERAEKSEAWQAAIGLQAVDGLKTSDYLLDTAKEHIEGKITIDEAQKRIHSYYEQRTNRTEAENETKEADIVSARITKLLGEKAFQFSPAEWITIHRRLFEGVFNHAGQIRQYNISKKEWILNGETVIYADFNSIRDTLDYDFATEKQVSVTEMLQRMGLDPDAVQQQMLRGAMQTFDREMAQGAYYEGLRLGGELSQMRMDTLEYNELENLCLLLPEQDQLVLRGKYSCEEGWQQLDMELSLPPADTPVLTDTYDGVQVQLEGTQATITLSPAPKTDQWGDIGIRVEQEHSYPILGAYNEYVDVCIGEQEDGFFRPVVYLLTKDGVVEYVDVLHCLMFGSALVCQDPIYIANQGVALERSGSEVNLRRADGSVLELAPLTAEWNAQELPYEVTGAFNDMGDDQFDWMDVESNGSVQMGVQDNNVFYQGYADYLGVVPEGMVLGVSTSETADGMPGITFVAAVKYDLYNETLSLTMLDGQNPFAEGKTQLQLTRCPDP